MARPSHVLALLKERKGFSILEFLVVIIIFSILVVVITKFRSDIGAVQDLITKRLTGRRDVDQALQAMASEISGAGPSSLGAYPIESAATSSFVFFSDVDRDGVFERVRYFLGTSTLEKGIIEPSGNPLVYATSSESVSTFVQGVMPTSTAPIFAYYGASYTGAQTSSLPLPIDVTSVRVVRVSLYVDISTSTSPTPAFFTHTVTVRNLRGN